MKFPRSTFISIFYLFILIIFASGIIWANVRFAESGIGGEEFLTIWESGRAYIEDETDPYSQSVLNSTRESIRNTQGIDGSLLTRLDYPFYTQLLFLPIIVVEDYILARGLWLLVLELLTGLYVLLALLLIKWKPSPLVMGMLISFGLLWVPGFRALISGNPVILAVTLLAGSLLAVRGKLDELAGGFLALATFRSEAVGICVLFLLIWAIFSRRRRVVWGFLMAMAILVVVATIFYPEWFLSYVRANLANLENMNSLNSMISTQLPGIGSRLGIFINLIAGAILLIEWRKSFNKEFRWLLWTTSLTLVITPFIGIPVKLTNNTVLILPLFLFMSISSERWKEAATWINGSGLLSIFVAGWLFLASDIRSGSLNDSTAGFFLLPGLLTLGLYWVRWWAIRSPVSWEAGRSIPES